MAYLFGILIVSLFFGVMHFFTELKLLQKIQATVVVLLLVGGAIYYNYLQDSKADAIRETILHFNQGHTLKCQGQKISNKTYTLSIGTETFIAKANTKDSGKIFAASGCE